MDEKNQAGKERGSWQGIGILETLCFLVWLVGIFFFDLPWPRSSVALSRITSGASIFDLFLILVSVVGALAVFYLLRRRRALATAVSFLFGIIIFNSLVIFVEPLVALTVSVLIVFIERMYRSFVTNNFLVVLGVFAAAMVWAGSYQINFLLILIGLFALYDLAGVFWWKVLPQVAKNAAKTGIPLLLLVPKKGVSWLHPPMPETTASMLGAGDLFFPLLFLSAVSVQVGYWVALVSLAGALVGNVGNIFWAWKIKKGIPAIPLLAIGLAVGYWLGLLFFLAK